MKKSNFKKTACVVSACLSALFLSCNEKKVAGKYSLSVGVDMGDPYVNPLIQLADEEGYFKEYGLSLKFDRFDRSAEFEALQVGKTDTLYVEIIPELAQAAQGADLTLFAGTITGGEAILANKKVAAKVDLTNTDNWRGLTIADRIFSTDEFITKGYFLNKGWELEKDVHWKLFDSCEAIIAATLNGTTDIAIVDSFFVDSCISQGLVYLFPQTTLKEDYVCCRQTANGPKIRSDRDAYIAYLKGQIRAFKVYKTDEEKAINAIVRASRQDSDFVREYMYDSEGSQNMTYNPDPNYNGTLEVFTTMLGQGYLQADEGKSLRKLEEFFDISLYAQALKEVISEYPDENFYKDMWTYFEANNNQYPDFSTRFSI